MSRAVVIALFTPALVSALREGHSKDAILRDVLAEVVVGIVGTSDRG